ncbi:MAG: MotA/TolQ/ExbB proton channel family protein [Desulfovibrionaceae bacterium]|jgi:biopolymer transport protein ExbB|nr:MotA/TolQ/ExbB proton channel family protein [Desulfovibrionaceae bacterium]
MLQALHHTLEHLADGGPVMVPLLAASAWMWTLIVKKSLEMRRMSRTLGPTLARLLAAGGNCAPETMRRLLARQADGVERHVGTILTLAAACPLLGLLGTVTGMIATFDVIRQFGTGNARALSAGISQALITTQFGLVAALPGLVIGAHLRRRAAMLRTRAERAVLAREGGPDAATCAEPGAGPDVKTHVEPGGETNGRATVRRAAATEGA